MASILIRNLSDETKTQLRVRAAQHGRSLEAEARIALDQFVRDNAVPDQQGKGDWVDELQARMAAIGAGKDIELVVPEYEAEYVPIDFSKHGFGE
jgi:antitoxin FitA